MYGVMIVFAIVSWFVGLVLDANLASDMPGILGLRILFPLIAVGLCILKVIKDKD